MRPRNDVIVAAGSDFFGYHEKFVLELKEFRASRVASEAEFVHALSRSANEVHVVVCDLGGKQLLDRVAQVLCMCGVTVVLVRYEGDAISLQSHANVLLTSDMASMREHVARAAQVRRDPEVCTRVSDGGYGMWLEEERRYNVQLGKQIQRRRRSLKLTQGCLAERIGVHRNTLNAWELGRRGIQVYSHKRIFEELAAEEEREAQASRQKACAGAAL